MSEANEALFRRWVDEVWNKGRERTIDELLVENVVVNYQFHSEENPIEGRENYKKFVRFFRGFFTDILVNIEQIAADENKVVAYCSFRVKPQKSDERQSASEPVKSSGLCQVIIEHSKIVQIWSNIDLFGQVG